MVQLNFSQTANVKKGWAGRLFLALFMSVFLAAGLFFLYQIGRQWLADFDTYS